MPDAEYGSIIEQLTEDDSVFRLLSNSKPAEHNAPTLDARTILLYLVGGLDEPSIRLMERSLLRRNAERRSLIEAVRTLASLKRMPFSEVQRISGGDTFEAQFAQAWLEYCDSQAQLIDLNLTAPTFSNDIARETRSFDIWQAITSLGSSPLPKAISAAIETITEQIRLSMLTASMSPARGGASRQLVMSGRIDIDCIVRACDIDEDGRLHCRIEVFPPINSENLNLDLMDGSRVELSLTLQGLRLPIGIAPLIGRVAEWDVPRLGEMTGIIDGPLPLERISVSLLSEELDSNNTAFTSQLKLQLMAPVVDYADRELDLPAIELMVRTDRLGSNRHLRIELPESTVAAFPTSDLCMDILIASAQIQHLGCWPISEMKRWESGRYLELTAPGVTSLRPRLRQL